MDETEINKRVVAVYQGREAGQTIAARMSGTVLGQPAAVTIEVTLPDNMKGTRELAATQAHIAWHALYGPQGATAEHQNVEAHVEGEYDEEGLALAKAALDGIEAEAQADVAGPLQEDALADVSDEDLAKWIDGTGGQA